MNLALFDFDNTITFKDSFGPFLKFSLTTRQQIIGTIKLAPWLLAYRTGYLNDQAIRQRLCAEAYRGYQIELLEEIGKEYAQVILPTLIRAEALECILWHQQRGDQVVVVSSSLDVYLNAWCQQQGIDLICNQLEVRAGRYTGKLHQGDCGYAEKARRIKQKYRLDDFDVIYAYGDSPNDLEMLKLAHKKYYQWEQVME